MNEETAKANDSTKISFMNFSTIDLPKITENISKGIVEYGVKNNYPQLLTELAHSSPTHSRVLLNKSIAIIGKGAKLRTSVSTETEARFNAWLEAPNEEEDFSDLLKKVINDFVRFGAFALEVIWSQDYVTIAEINHINVSKTRIEPINEDGEITGYQYSRDWQNTRKAINAPKRIAKFNPKKAKADGGRQLLYVMKYDAGADYYGTPDYIAAIEAIQIEAALFKFHNTNLANGCMPTIHVSFTNGIPSDEKVHMITKDFERKYSGVDNAGKSVVTFSNGTDTAPSIKAIEKGTTDSYYTNLLKDIAQAIMTAHGVTSPMLMGIKTEGQLGGASELDTAYQIFDKTVINEDRETIEKAFNKLLKYIVTGVKLYLEPSNPIDFRLSETVLSQIMSVNELRAKMNLRELSDEEIAALKLSASAPEKLYVKAA